MTEIADLKDLDYLWNEMLPNKYDKEGNKVIGYMRNRIAASFAMMDFITFRSGLDDLPISDKRKEKIYEYAWAQSHSSGYNAIYETLCDLVDLFSE